MFTHMFNQVSDLLHPFAIWFHYHELVLGAFAFLAHLSAALQAADASVNMLHVNRWHKIHCQQQAAASYSPMHQHRLTGRQAGNTVKPYSFGLMHGLPLSDCDCASSVTQGSNSDLAACTGHRHNVHERKPDNRQD